MGNLRKLDVVLAEKLGYEVDICQEDFLMYREDIDKWVLVPYWSTESEAMLELDREMWGKGYFLRFICGGSLFIAIYVQDDTDYSFSDFSLAKNEPLARALAAYKALTGKEWEG